MEVFRKEVDESEAAPGLWTIDQHGTWHVIKRDGVEYCRTEGNLSFAKHILYCLSCYD